MHRGLLWVCACMCCMQLVHTEWRGQMINRSGVMRAVVENEAGGQKCGQNVVHWSSEVEVEVTQSCLSLCHPMDCSIPGFSVHGILQARILEWFTISFSRGSSQPRDWIWVSHIGGRQERNGKPLQYCCLENPMNNMTRQKDMTLKDELPRSVGAQYATGEEWRNDSRKNEETEPKQK